MTHLEVVITAAYALGLMAWGYAPYRSHRKEQVKRMRQYNSTEHIARTDTAHQEEHTFRLREPYRTAITCLHRVITIHGVCRECGQTVRKVKP